MTGPVCCWIYSNSCKLVRTFGWDCRRNCDHIDPQESVLGHQQTAVYTYYSLVLHYSIPLPGKAEVCVHVNQRINKSDRSRWKRRAQENSDYELQILTGQFLLPFLFNKQETGCSKLCNSAVQRNLVHQYTDSVIRMCISVVQCYEKLRSRQAMH